ncbi:putative anti-sigmaE protein [Actinomyces bovis]|uniref:Anti-sigmaE protein n=1 Tax=Actinomyces bovis TaxID=1658 RepID=A0ABY1VMA8_9ACTO|nr:anti-sigma factor [Actinomyces bovis]SPT53238.1 putative anti-sigmaE protein [Actinomyces bovis]VEG52491.1 putative anti-sigmaE protein [Actinomyces israelii]
MSQDQSTGMPMGDLSVPSKGDDAELLAALEADEALAVLATSLPPVEPSPGLRAAVLGAIAREVEAEAASKAEGAQAEVLHLKTASHLLPTAKQDGRAEVTALPQPADQPESSTAATSSVGGAQVLSLPSRRRWLTGALQVAASVAVLAVGVGIGRWSAMDSMAPTQHFAQLNQAQDVQRVTDTMPDGHIATLTWSKDMSMTALALPDQMMSDAAGASLQVWLLKEGQVRSLGLYDPAKGAGFTFLDPMLEPGERVFITLEPKGGSSRPSGEPLVVFDVSAKSEGTTPGQSQVQTSAPTEA